MDIGDSAYITQKEVKNNPDSLDELIIFKLSDSLRCCLDFLKENGGDAADLRVINVDVRKRPKRGWSSEMKKLLSHRCEDASFVFTTTISTEQKE